jgi:inner membrane protein
MPTIITHAVFSAATSRVIGPKLDMRVVTAAAVLSILPDIDVLSFAFGIPYGHPLGHRGLTHSIAFAVVAAALARYLIPADSASSRAVWTVYFISAVSHPLLDAMTNGGRGVALFAPFDNTRFFFPFRPIEVSPIGLQGFLSARGATVLANEFLWIWIPATLVVGLVWFARKRRHDTKEA